MKLLFNVNLKKSKNYILKRIFLVIASDDNLLVDIFLKGI